MDASSEFEAGSVARSIVGNVERVIVGHHEAVTRAVAALLAGGHILIEDVPGVGKTMLAKAIACSVDGVFKRIQFTADLLPSDVTGVSVYQQRSESFAFRAGPIFANILVGDEINRATPRTQSSLLEAMEEYQVTVDGASHPLSQPFFVIATQNPIELEGTYPLPFAQMDRFMIRLRLGYLAAEEERRMVEERLHQSPLDSLEPVVDCDGLSALQEAARTIEATRQLLDYVVSVVRRTRELDSLHFGASPRASLDLWRYSQALALIRGRAYVLPDDVKDAAAPVLAHRLIVRRGSRHATLSSDSVVEEILTQVEVPV